MMTALPSDWNFPKEDPHAIQSAPSDMSTSPVHLEQGFFNSNSGKQQQQNPQGTVGSNLYEASARSQQQQKQAPLYHDRWSAAPTGPNVWTDQRGSGAAMVAGGVVGAAASAAASTTTGASADASSQHSRGSIWADDHSSRGSQGSGGGLGAISKGNIQSDGVLEDDFEIPGHDDIDFGLAHLNMNTAGNAGRKFSHRLSIGAAGSYDEDDYGGTASSFYETATIAGYPTQDFGGLDFATTASVDSNGIPGLMPASSGSTYGTLLSGASADMSPPPPPGFGETSQKHKYQNAGAYHHQQQQRGRHSSGNRRSRNNGRSYAPSSSWLPMKERSNTPGVLRETLPLNVGPSSSIAAGGGNKTALPPRNFQESTTSFTLEESSSNHSLDISTSSEAIRQLMHPKAKQAHESEYNDVSCVSLTERTEDFNYVFQSRLPTTLEDSSLIGAPILPTHVPVDDDISCTFHADDDEEDFTFNDDSDFPLDHEDDLFSTRKGAMGISPPTSKKQEWLFRMTRKMQECPVGELDPSIIPMNAVMNGWAKSKSTQGAAMVEEWLQRAEKEFAAGNTQVVPTTKMYTMAVDAWARSGKGGAASQRAEALLQQMYNMYKKGDNPALKPTTGIFNAVINAWARSMEPIAPSRAEQILDWMDNLKDMDVRPDKYTFNTVIHAYSKAGGKEAAVKAQDLLMRMQRMHREGNVLTKADTITYNCVINCWAKSSRGGEAANEAEKLLNKMHRLYEMGDPDVKPNVVTYGAVIDAFAKSGTRGAAAKADALLANMIRLHQSDPVKHADLMPNTYVFNTVINCWSKSKERDAASKAEEMLVAMGRLHASGMNSLKPDAFTYTAVIDAWSKSFLRGAADRANLLLDKMEVKYQNGDTDLKPNTFTYNAVINALAKSCEAGAAARAERVLQNMVNRHRNGGGDDVKPTTINFNTVLDAWAKSGGGRAAAERAEEILEWMDRLCKQSNKDVAPDTISFNAVLDAWARSGDRNAPRRCEQILDHMDELYRGGNMGVKPDTYTYNTLINSWAKSSMSGAASRAEQVLQVMEKRFRDGDSDFKPNTRTYTSVIDAWAKSSERGAARRCESILNSMIRHYEASGDEDARPNVHTANAVCNACAFSKHDDDRGEALQIAFRVFDWLTTQTDMQPDSYTYTILLSVCANLIPRHDTATRFGHARSFFESCRDAGYVNDYVLRKLRQTVTEEEYLMLLEYRTDAAASSMPAAWSRNTKPDAPSKRKNKWNNHRRRG